MKEYSEVTQHANAYGWVRDFRYNYTDNRLEYVYTPSSEDVGWAINDMSSNFPRMRAAAKRDLDSYNQTGYFIMYDKDLSREEWESDPKLCVSVFSDDMDQGADDDLEFASEEVEHASNNSV